MAAIPANDLTCSRWHKRLELRAAEHGHSVPEVAADRGVPLVILNDEPTPMDVAAAVVVRGRAGEALPEIARLAAGI